MFTVDPSSILSTLLKAGGIFIPRSSQKDIQILRECLHCERAEMNVVDKTMILYNATIGIAGQPAALTVGRTYVYWASYVRPTLDVQVDDVDLLMEFRNALLTKSNWQDLRRRGFPPDVVVSSSNTTHNGKEIKTPSTQEAQTANVVRVGSIDLSGMARVRITSKWLQKDLGSFVIDMDSFDDFTELMQQSSERQYRETGRRGITPDDLATMLQRYFAQKIRDYLHSYVDDVVIDSRDMYQDARGVVDGVANSILTYVADASRKTGDELQEKVITNLGISKSRLDRLRNSLQQINTTALRHAFVNNKDRFYSAFDQTDSNSDDPSFR